MQFERNFSKCCVPLLRHGCHDRRFFCKCIEITDTACAHCKYQCSVELRSRIIEEFSRSAGGPNELGWARPSNDRVSAKTPKTYISLGFSSAIDEMCKKTPLFCLSTGPNLLVRFLFRRSLNFSTRCARGQTINPPGFPKNPKVSVRPARENLKNRRGK